MWNNLSENYTKRLVKVVTRDVAMKLEQGESGQIISINAN